MAVKKASKKQEESAPPTKAEAKATAPKKAAKKGSAAKAASPAPAAEPTPTPTPAPAAKSAPTPASAATTAPKKAAAKKGAAPIKLSPSQEELLKKIAGSETGYVVEKKVEERSIEALANKKLIKKGAKDKATGKVPYHATTGGKKHIS